MLSIRNFTQNMGIQCNFKIYWKINFWFKCPKNRCNKFFLYNSIQVQYRTVKLFLRNFNHNSKFALNITFYHSSLHTAKMFKLWTILALAKTTLFPSSFRLSDIPKEISVRRYFCVQKWFFRPKKKFLGRSFGRIMNRPLISTVRYFA